jgi:hypothetical protein
MSKGRALGLSTTYGRKRGNVALRGTFLPDGYQTAELALSRTTASTSFRNRGSRSAIRWKATSITCCLRGEMQRVPREHARLQRKQGNRNPLIDHPEWAEQVRAPEIRRRWRARRRLAGGCGVTRGDPDISRSRTGSTKPHINARAATGSAGYGDRMRVVRHMTGFLSARGQTSHQPSNTKDQRPEGFNRPSGRRSMLDSRSAPVY